MHPFTQTHIHGYIHTYTHTYVNTQIKYKLRHKILNPPPCCFLCPCPAPAPKCLWHPATGNAHDESPDAQYETPLLAQASTSHSSPQATGPSPHTPLVPCAPTEIPQIELVHSYTCRIDVRSASSACSRLKE
jgi:hypothetical protein